MLLLAANELQFSKHRPGEHVLSALLDATFARYMNVMMQRSPIIPQGTSMFRKRKSAILSSDRVEAQDRRTPYLRRMLEASNCQMTHGSLPVRSITRIEHRVDLVSATCRPKLS
ncbi:hypothetical protein HBH43_021810 [Parastagonospora nodorum]|nr:hypothetical protein HBH43_021810 [Parastagonospora nodorum]KAH5125366.1 hypothetical protein HBH71_005890 [Parastagonospora nodorum]KAH5269572.1 hypothetical protein HBI71_060720 [Parastagonospora nodorum]